MLVKLKKKGESVQKRHTTLRVKGGETEKRKLAEE